MYWIERRIELIDTETNTDVVAILPCNILAYFGMRTPVRVSAESSCSVSLYFLAV